MACLALESADDALFWRMANLAPATACGLSRPVTAVRDLGRGSKLVRRDEAANELAGLGVASGEFSSGFAGCIDALLFASADMEDCEARRGGGFGGFWLAAGPCAASLSRKDSLETAGFEGVASGAGDADDARLRGLRMGSLDDAGVREDTERTVLRVVLA